MASPLENLARKMEEDPFFLACPLRLYSQSEGLDEEKLAAMLGCSSKDLMFLRLCRSPAPGSEQFQKDIDRIANRFPVRADVLAEAVRRGQAILHLRKGQGRQAGTLLAARDGDQSKERGKKGGGKS